MQSNIINGESEEILKTYPDNHFDACVSDPPYGLGKEPNIVDVMRSWCEKGYHEVTGSGFMGKEWDAFVPQPNLWKEVLRVLKPGAHILCACGTRTQDWMAASLRFAGFEIRDIITWHYGSGFPKSLDISKAIDAKLGCEREVVGERKTGIGTGKGATPIMQDGNRDITAPSSDLAKKYEGWGTALKPATELWTLARKPFKGTVADNVMQYGTGGLNIDACRIGTEEIISHAKIKGESFTSVGAGQGFNGKEETANTGRFPANVIFDDFMAAELDKQSGFSESKRGVSGGYDEYKKNEIYGKYKDIATERGYDDSGGAGRFFMQISGCNIDFFTYIYNSLKDIECGSILEKKKAAGIVTGVFLEVEKFINDVALFIDGNKSMDHSQPDMKYITETLTNQMMQLKICNCLQGMNIDYFMQDLLRTINLLTTLNTGSASTAEVISHLSSLLLDLLGHFKAIVGIAQNNNYSSGAVKTGSAITPTIDNIDCENNRFFYVAKPSPAEREFGVKWMAKQNGGNRGNIHLTVKPIELMQYLIRLITPVDGHVLDPFNGSGTTGIAAKMEFKSYTGIEREEIYCEISKARISAYHPQIPLF